MPEIGKCKSDEEDQEVVFVIDYGNKSFSYLRPTSQDPALGGWDTLKRIADQKGMSSVHELITRINAGQTFKYD